MVGLGVDEERIDHGHLRGQLGGAIRPALALREHFRGQLQQYGLPKWCAVDTGWSVMCYELWAERWCGDGYQPLQAQPRVLVEKLRVGQLIPVPMSTAAER